jgi:perosamine synthetase
MMNSKLNISINQFIERARLIYGDDFIPLHRPLFNGNEKEYLCDCIDSNFVSSVGSKVVEFENKIAAFVGSNYAIAVVNGTAALHVALQLSGVRKGDEVLTQALTFIATCNAISYLGAHPVFIDVSLQNLGLCPEALRNYLSANAKMEKGFAWNVNTGRRISACVPMHTFGIPCKIDEISEICSEWNIELIEDAAESLGSYFNKRHTGTYGKFGILSFNGNKVITTGGGGMIFTDNEDLAKRAKHITTTAKIPHPYEFEHDEVGYNYRMPNLNAALGCAQIEKLDHMLEVKEKLALSYRQLFSNTGINIVLAPENTRPNNWLNAVILKDKLERDYFLQMTNDNKVMTRPIWRLMSDLQMFSSCQHDGLKNSKWLEERVVNLPSSVPETQLPEFI